MREIAIISQYFYPSLASTAQLMTDLASGLSNEGYRVKVFTGCKLSDIEPEFLHQVEVTRSLSLFSREHSILFKITSSLFFIIGAFIYIIFHLPKKTPLLIASNPPYAGVLGLCFKLLKGGKFYFLLQDVFPESAVMSEIIQPNSLVFKFFSYITYLTCKYSKYTIVLSGSMKKYLEHKYLELKEKENLKIIENWAIEDISISEKANNKFAIEHGLNKIFTVLYSGNIGRLHDIETIASTAKLLSDRPIQFVFIGDGPKKQVLEDYIQKHQLNNILLLPFQPRETLSLSLTACDVSLISLVEGAEQIIAPCKLYGILAAGRAIVSISSLGSYLDHLITENDCGCNCPPNNSQQLATIINELAADPKKVTMMGKKARQLYEEKYTFSRALAEYEQILFL